MHSYTPTAKALHWLTAALILALIPLGIIANDMPYDTSEQLARKAWVFSWHKTLGVAVFFTAVVRIAYAMTHPSPAPLHPHRRVETFLATTAHWTLYACLILVPAAGWIHHAATTGFAPIWWPLGQSLPFVPKNANLAHVFASLHILFERVLVISLVLHIAGAAKHALIDRDGTLARMLPLRGAPTPPYLPRSKHRAGPVLAAATVFGVAIAAGAGLGMFAPTDRAPTPQLAAISSDWVVRSGTLSITVTQLGSAVTGQFADWTAAITFDETVTTGPAGSVTATVSIPSLTLGSVTEQALGAEFLNAASFATATFDAPLSVTPEGYVATGTLTMAGQTHPVTLPFKLEIADGTATMSGTTTLDRRTFGMGASYSDEATVGFTVVVDIALTAARP
jgi:cytochrome b561/polyisoprenoid-binding protein YceI